MLLAATRIEDALVVALGGVGIGSAVHAVGHVLDRHLGGAPALDLPLHAAISVVLLAAAGTRWRALRSTT